MIPNKYLNFSQTLWDYYSLKAQAFLIVEVYWNHFLHILVPLFLCIGFQGCSVIKNPPANAGETGNWRSTLGSGISPGGGNGNLIQYSLLENRMSRGAWSSAKGLWGCKVSHDLARAPVQHIPRYSVQFSSVQSLSCVWLFATPLITAHQASLSITSSQSLLKLMPIESVMPSSHLILCCPLLLLPPTTPSMRVFSNKSTLHMRWPKYWSFSFSISPYNEHPGLISFRMNWLDLLTVQGTLKSLLQNHSSKASIFQHSAFFTVQLTSMHDHWKNHSLDQTELCWQINVSAF